ncbi:MAG: site-specific recombinase [candidate division CPR2 bacterium GW2011_GWC1_41_48]|uniref:Site-specific recombinase n=1 Tax=candidate division CPR2 bacterium GW2011_GWC1_41_48 TaxID=1618344 RepID=A0A0G0W9X7_UNCC2|nr:MAG: Site-specific recombinase [candidate division CPR2 bacterium GW2011_GWC2_39_35]KKR27187.1 MAG: Site-specific recombinase [candidate division CPR2 bacterium GW2011_GWD1_39_7]KKR28692.1 MAG: Site-specific recombinase [candidate division CPR2 bacterium GW2011_GWD2_39_7]KKS09770.1 MAG: site-specific recombinase [candidate division CPR2 bacterium GW2011_GWC1_41_48]
MSQINFGKTALRPEKAVIYVRVSSEDQVENYSLGTQEDICRKDARNRGFDVLQVFKEEGRSAKTINGRPTLIEMLEFCRKQKREIAAVIVYRLDRISRETADYLVIRRKLTECDIKLVSATEPTGNSPTEKFVETMLAGFAQMDNDVRGERSRNGLRARFQAGLAAYVPLGYINQNGYAIKDPATSDKIKEAWDLVATGTKTLREIADILTKQGVTQRQKGGPIRPQTINRLFHNKFYTGKVISKKYGQEVEGQHPAMITEELFYKVQAILDGRNTNISTPIMRRNQDNPDFPLRRIVRCKHCDSPLTGAWTQGKTKRYAYYFCPNRCSKSFSVDELNLATMDYLAQITPTVETLELFNTFLKKTYYQRISTLQKRREDADIELKKLYGTRQALIQKNLSGVYSDEMFKEQNKVLEEKIKDIQVTKNDELIGKYNLEDITNFIRSKFENLSQTFANSNLDQTRILLSSIFPSGLVWQDERYSNSEISPFYCIIIDFQPGCVPFGWGGGIRTPECWDQNPVPYRLATPHNQVAGNSKQL